MLLVFFLRLLVCGGAVPSVAAAFKDVNTHAHARMLLLFSLLYTAHYVLATRALCGWLRARTADATASSIPSSASSGAYGSAVGACIACVLQL